LTLSPAFVPTKVELGLEEDETNEEEIVPELDELTPLDGEGVVNWKS
jgi:hypothetical protein